MSFVLNAGIVHVQNICITVNSVLLYARDCFFLSVFYFPELFFYQLDSKIISDPFSTHVDQHFSCESLFGNANIDSLIVSVLRLKDHFIRAGSAQPV